MEGGRAGRGRAGREGTHLDGAAGKGSWESLERSGDGLHGGETGGRWRWQEERQ